MTVSRQSVKLPSIATQLSYARDGHVCTRNLLSKQQLDIIASLLRDHMNANELRSWRQKVEVAADSELSSSESAASAKRLASSCTTVAECQAQLKTLLHTDKVEVPFLQFFNTWRSHPSVWELARTLAPVACTLLGKGRLRLYQDAVFWKRKGDGPTPWHADAPMAPFDTQHMITAWIPLRNVPTGLVYCSQSHADVAWLYWNHDSLNKVDLSERYRDPPVEYSSLVVGDVTWHSGWTLHCADAADRDRMALALTFVDAAAPIRLNAECSGDREDAESYRDWISQVPRNTPDWDHPWVPVLDC